MNNTDPKFILVMGVSGSGKSTIGLALAEKLGLPFLDADDYHPESNVEKMSKGTALTDSDRWPWLHQVATELQKRSTGSVFACSALKERYRQFLSERIPNLKIIFLAGERATLLTRMEGREHFMPTDLLDDQLNTLEIPEDTVALTLSIELTTEQLITEASQFVNKRYDLSNQADQRRRVPESNR
jgi:gluconokinase